MAGRVSQIDQAAAITRVVQVAAFAPTFRHHVTEIVTSPAFKGSRRSQDFLTYIVEQSLAGHFDALKERALGVELFGRDPSYDTGEDAIVRVTASDVRRRLQQFYGHSTSEWRIDLPAGSYIPEFHKSDSPAEQHGQEPIVVERAGTALSFRHKYWYYAIALAVLALGAWRWFGTTSSPQLQAVSYTHLTLPTNREV